MRASWMGAILAALAACNGGSKDEGDSPPPVEGDTDTDTDADADNGAVHMDLALTTRDGVTLVADAYDAGENRPAILLLHADPQGTWSRKDWPDTFMGTLFTHNWSVMALDRRGAGASDGDPLQASVGPKGKFDVEAAVDWFEGRGAASLVIIGASNGTTSMIDYSVAAKSEGWMEPIALGFMTGGSYTENNNPMSAVPVVPSVFTYTISESTWSDVQQTGAPGSWAFHEYQANNGHGTDLFTAAPEVADDLEAFLEGLLP